MYIKIHPRCHADRIAGDIVSKDNCISRQIGPMCYNEEMHLTL